MTQGFFGLSSDSTQYIKDKAKYEYTLKNEYRKVIPQTVNSVIAKSIEESKELYKKYGIDGITLLINENPKSIDTEYPYENKNAVKDSPIATDYEVNIKASSFEALEKGFMVDKFSFTEMRGQVQTKGNDVPIGNTFNAFLTNNNENTTATIHNTTTKKLAHNLFQTLDNIQVGDLPGIVRVEQGINNTKRTGLMAPDRENPNFARFMDIKLKQGIKNDGIITKDEFTEGMLCYAFAAKEFSMRNALNNTQNGDDPQKRIKSTETVDLDGNDPFFKFFDKVSKLDNQDGMTEAELEQALNEMAIKSEPDKDGNQTLIFNKQKFKEFLAKDFNANKNDASK